MFQEVFHQTMSFKFFSHIDFIVKRFLFQFQKILEGVSIAWPWPASPTTTLVTCENHNLQEELSDAYWLKVFLINCCYIHCSTSSSDHTCCCL
jgi:hypothetical protein